MDLVLFLIILLFKLTISPDMPWLLVFSPFFVTFILGFIRGHHDSQEEKYKE